MLRHSYGLFIFCLLLTWAAAQQKPAGKSVAPATASAPRAAELPSDATVTEFIKHMFGYDSSLTWKVQSIKPSRDPSIAEVAVLMSGKQGQQLLSALQKEGQSNLKAVCRSQTKLACR